MTDVGIETHFHCLVDITLTHSRQPSHIQNFIKVLSFINTFIVSSDNHPCD